MFTEENIKRAVRTLCDLFDEDERWMLDDAYFDLEGISADSIIRALDDRMEDVFEYKALSTAGDTIDYRGRYLFGHRAMRLLTVENFTVADDHYGMDYDVELWLLEDMTFAKVCCFRTMIAEQEYLDALTEYRIIQGYVEENSDLFFTIEELLEELDCIFCLAESYEK